MENGVNTFQNILQGLFLGMLQGLTEFLPVSSSAHLVLAPYFFQFKDPGLAFDVALHMGTLAAILIAFRSDWIHLLQKLVGPFNSTKKFKDSDSVSLQTLFIACLPAGIAGLLLNHWAEETFRNPVLIAVTLSVFGILLWIADTRGEKKKSLRFLEVEKYKRSALLIGFAQALALIPGVSRSGITITAALFLGLERQAALRFSFLLSAPVIFGAGAVKGKEIYSVFINDLAVRNMMYIGFLASLFFGLLAIYLLRYLASSRSFKPFTIYRLILSFIILIVVFFR